MAADLVLNEHPRCSGVFCDPDHAKIEALKPDAALTLRRASDLLAIPARDLDELLDSGALKSATDGNGRTVIRASDLQTFHAGLRLVAFAETDLDDEGDEDDDDAAAPAAAPTRRQPAPPPPVAVAVAVPAASVDAADDAPDMAPVARRTNPTTSVIASDDEPGWIKLRLSDLARLLRGDTDVAPAGK